MNSLVFLAYNNDAASGAVLGGMGFVLFLVAVAAYALFCWPLAKIFAKADKTPWHAWVPVLNTWQMFSLGGIPGFLCLIPVVSGFAWLFAMINLTNRFNQPGGIAIIGWFVPWLWAFMIGFGDAVWVGQRDPQGNLLGAQGAQGQGVQAYGQQFAPQGNGQFSPAQPTYVQPAYPQQQYGQQAFAPQQPDQQPYAQYADGGFAQPATTPLPNQPAALPESQGFMDANAADPMFSQPLVDEQQEFEDSSPKSLTDIGLAVGADTSSDSVGQVAAPEAQQADDYWAQAPEAGTGTTVNAPEMSQYSQFAPPTTSQPSAELPVVQDNANNTGWQTPEVPGFSVPAPPAPPVAPMPPVPPAGAASAATPAPTAPAVPAVPGVPSAPIPEPVSESVPEPQNTLGAVAGAGVEAFSGDEEDDGETVIVRRSQLPQWQIESASGTIIPLTGTEFLLGRKPVASVKFPRAQLIAIHDPAKTVSKVHALLQYDDVAETWTITDLGSTNGVFVGDDVDEVPAGASAELKEDFMLGELSLRLSRLEG